MEFGDITQYFSEDVVFEPLDLATTELGPQQAEQDTDLTEDYISSLLEGF